MLTKSHKNNDSKGNRGKRVAAQEDDLETCVKLNEEQI